MAKFQIFTRGNGTIADTLHFETVYRDTMGRYDLAFQNISDTADLRRIHISVLDVEIPFVPTAKTTSWISVKEKVPEYLQNVLIYIKRPHEKEGRIVFGHRVSTDASGHMWSIDYSHYITHWMPLPEPPREYVDTQVAPLMVPYPCCKGPDGEGPERGE